MSNIVQEIKNLNIAEIIQHYLPLNKKGANYLGVCPFHHDSKPSLTVNNEKRIFKCFACGVSGDAIQFVQKFNNFTYHQAIQEIAKLFNLEINYDEHWQKKEEQSKTETRLFSLNQRYLELCQVFAQQKNEVKLQQYLSHRGLTQDIIEYFGIGFNPSPTRTLYELLTNESGKYVNIAETSIFTRQELLDNNLVFISQSGEIYDTFSGRLIFSIKNSNGQIVGFSGRTIDGKEPKYLNTASTKLFNKNHILYNFHNLKKENDNDQIILVEGFMDVIALYKAGFNNVVATMGTAFSKFHIDLIKTNKNIKTIVLAFDNDDAGLQAIIQAGFLINNSFNVFVVQPYSKEYKDFDELLQKEDAVFVKNVINHQEHFSVFYLKYLCQNASLSSESNKLDFLKKATNFLQTFGVNLYTDKYIDLIVNYTGLDLKIINNEISNVLSNQKLVHQTVNTNQTYQFGNNNYIVSQLITRLETYKKMSKRLIMACLKHAEAVQIIKNQILQLGKTKVYKQFDDIYEHFITTINLLDDFYLEFENKTCITSQDVELLNNFIQNYDNYFKTYDYITFLESCLLENDNVNLEYKYTYNNLIKTIDSHYLSDLEIRKNLLIVQYNKQSNNYPSHVLSKLAEYKSLINKRKK